MSSKEEAQQLALEFVTRERKLDNDDYIILDEYTHETQDTYSFIYDTKKFIETGNPEYALVIYIPIIVSKADGTCKFL